MEEKTYALDVAYCCSDLFAEVCAVSIVSLCINNSHFKEINIYIIEDQISTQNKNRLESMVKKYGRNIFFIPIIDPAEFYKDDRFTIKSLGRTYSRMVLGDVLPKTVNKVLSLDSDTIILGKLDELCSIDLTSFPIAGVDDCYGAYALEKDRKLPRDSFNLNAGMFLINLDTWRKQNWTQLFYEYMKAYFDTGKKSIGYYEEIVINTVLKDQRMRLHPKFQLMTIEQVLSYDEMLYFREPLHYYSREEIEEAKKNPIITHGLNFFYVKKRLYEENSDHPMYSEYVKYRELTPWNCDPFMQVNKTFKQRMAKEVWHMVPRKTSIRIAKFVRNHIRPMLNKKRDDE